MLCAHTSVINYSIKNTMIAAGYWPYDSNREYSNCVEILIVGHILWTSSFNPFALIEPNLTGPNQNL
jgi:hypothetical protein